MQVGMEAVGSQRSEYDLGSGAGSNCWGKLRLASGNGVEGN